MNTFGMISASLPLGLDFIEILLHMLNLLILVLGVRFLLYKPIKKFMEKREAEYIANEESAKKAEEKSQAMTLACNRLINEARAQAVKISEDATVAAKVQSDELLEKARQNAEKLIEKAERDILLEQNKAKEALVLSATELAVDIAAKMLEREVTAKDNDAVIDAIVSGWGKESIEEQ